MATSRKKKLMKGFLQDMYDSRPKTNKGMQEMLSKTKAAAEPPEPRTKPPSLLKRKKKNRGPY